MIKENEKPQSNKGILLMIQSLGILGTIKMVGGYDNFNKAMPDYFYHRDESGTLRMDRNRIIEFLNECVEDNERIEGESYIYFSDYDGDILYQEWDGEGDDDTEYFTYESRIMSIGTDVAHLEVWQYDDEGNMFDDAHDYYDMPLNRLENKFLNKIFEQVLWGI